MHTSLVLLLVAGVIGSAAEGPTPTTVQGSTITVKASEKKAPPKKKHKKPVVAKTVPATPKKTVWDEVAPVKELRSGEEEVKPEPTPTPAPEPPPVVAAPTPQPAPVVVPVVAPAPIAPAEPVPTPVVAPPQQVTPTVTSAAPQVTPTVTLPPPQAPIPAPMPPRAPQTVPPIMDGSTGMDLSPYAAPLPADPNHKRRPWNIRPVTYYGRLDSMSFNAYNGHTDDGSTLRGTLSPDPGIGFGASLEAFPMKWGAIFFSFDYRYGFSSKLSLDGPALYQTGTLNLAAQHQASLGAHAGFRMPWNGEWSMGLEYRAEGYKVSGPSGSPSTAWLQRPWARVGARWSLNVIRDLRPFIGVDVAMPLTGAPNVSNTSYNQDVKNLLGIYPAVPVGTIPSTTSADAIGRAHAGKLQFGVVYGIRFFRPRRRWMPAAAGVQVVPTAPTDKKGYEVPKEAYEPVPDKPKEKEKTLEPPKKDN